MPIQGMESVLHPIIPDQILSIEEEEEKEEEEEDDEGEDEIKCFGRNS